MLADGDMVLRGAWGKELAAAGEQLGWRLRGQTLHLWARATSGDRRRLTWQQKLSLRWQPGTAEWGAQLRRTSERGWAWLAVRSGLRDQLDHERAWESAEWR